MLTKPEFDAYAARGFNRVPLARDLLADLETPLSTYLKLGAGPYSYLLESVQGGEKWPALPQPHRNLRAPGPRPP